MTFRNLNDMRKAFLNLFSSTLLLSAAGCAESPDAGAGIESSARSAQPSDSATQNVGGVGMQGSAEPTGNPSNGNSLTPGDPEGPVGSGSLSTGGTPTAVVGLGGFGQGGDGGRDSSENGGSAQGGNAFGGTMSAGGAAGLPGIAGTTSDGGVPSAGGTNPGGSNNGGASEPGSSTFHVFLLLGQSNMAGYSRAEEEDKVEDERIQVLGFDDCSATGRTADEWDVAVPPLHECGPGALGPGDYFAKTLIERLPEGNTIGLVPCALSGQAVEVFSKGTDKYDWIIERAENAQELGGVIEGLLFHQGESNCGNSAWPAAVQALVEDLRADLNLGDDVPFLAGELPYDSACGTHNPLVNELPQRITNAHVVSAEGLQLDPADTAWYMHFGRDAQVEFGKRYEAKFVEVTGL